MTTMRIFVLSALTMCILVSDVDGFSEDHTITYEQLHDLGMDAYRQEKWSKCSTFLQKAIDDYHFYKDAVIDCRLGCKSKTPTEHLSLKPAFFHNMLEESNCLRRCKKKKFGMRSTAPQPTALDKKFEKRTLYNFLQFCLFQEGKLQEAAATAYTFYITNQDEERIIGNLQYYRDQDDVAESDFVDLERRPYQTAYVQALLAYNDGDWKTAAEQFEKSLELYFTEEERCKAWCERPFTHTGYPDFVNAVADHYVVVIVCQQNCLRKLSTFGMEELENFVSEHFNYLQFAYYNMEDYDQAVQAVANFLLLRPDNTEMMTNKEYYMKTLGLGEEKFMPSQTVIDYINYWRDVERSLDFVRDKYILPNSDIRDDDEDLQVDSEKKKQTNDTQEHYMSKYSQVGIKLFAEIEQLQGALRFAADEFLREDQCLSLADLAKSKDPNKLGIRSVSLREMLSLVEENGDYEMSLRLLLRASDIIRHYTAAYFNQSELGIKEVKVLCRAGGDRWEKEMPEDCIPQEDGSCLGDSLPDSEFLSVVYLSDISDGTGSFYFMDSEHKMQSSLQPRCGRLVGFATNNTYGVNFSWKKERCVVLLTFICDLDLATNDIKSGKDLLRNLEEAMVTESVALNNTAVLEEFYKQGVSISKTGEDLFGKERFAADGLATEKECQELIKLATKHGRTGDGYRGNISPHTDRELFTGLEITSVLKKGVVKDDGYDDRNQADPLASKYVSPYSKYENFAGLNISRALKLVTAGQVSAHALQLLLDISEQGRLLVETYFNLSKPLYFDFTHLVCRTALEVSGEDEEEDRDKDLSHPVHSDNCMIQEDGSCIPDESAYQQRHYSALMYLNGDFEGGEFFFAHKNKSEQVSLKPKCGRIVGFNAGEYHGVKAVTKGRRCALAMWLTLDANYKEISRFHTQRELDKMMKRLQLNKSKFDKVVEPGHGNIGDESDAKDLHEKTETNNAVREETNNAVRDELDSGKSRDVSTGDTDNIVDTSSSRSNSGEQHEDSKTDLDNEAIVMTLKSEKDEESTFEIPIIDSKTDLVNEETRLNGDDLEHPMDESVETSNRLLEESITEAEADKRDEL